MSRGDERRCGGGRGIYLHVDGDMPACLRGLNRSELQRSAPTQATGSASEPRSGLRFFSVNASEGSSREDSSSCPDRLSDIPVAALRGVKAQNVMTDCFSAYACLSYSEFVVWSWNACGMETGAINDMVMQLASVRWDAILMQEGPYSQLDSYSIIFGGHALFLAACERSRRSVGI